MIKSNLKGAAGVQINVRDISGRPSTTATPYRIGLVGWTPKGPSNIPTVVSSLKELEAIFGTPKGYKVNEVYLLHNAKILLNAGIELVIVRTVEASSAENLNYGAYKVTPKDGTTPAVGGISSTGASGVSNNMTVVNSGEKNLKLTASTDANFTAFLKYPGFVGYYMSVQTFESDIKNSAIKSTDLASHVVLDAVLRESNGTPKVVTTFENCHSLNASPSDNYYTSERAVFKSFIQSLGLYQDVYVSNGLVYGDVLSDDGIFYRLNGTAVSATGVINFANAEVNTDLNDVLSMLVIVRLYESKSSTTPLETIFATTREYVTPSGDQLEIESIQSNLLVFKEGVSTSVVDGCVGKVLLEGGNTMPYVRSSLALEYAWAMFEDLTNVEVSLLLDGGSSIAGFGIDKENDGSENSDMNVVTAILKASSSRMDAPCVIDLPKRSKVKDLIAYFKRFPSIGNEVDGSTANYATFWGNAQDGRQIVNDVYNKKQIEVARSIFKGLVAFNVFNTSYPWQTQWGPDRGLIGTPSLGTINPRIFPDEIGLLSQNRINPSKLNPSGEYFWDDYTLMAKSSVLQRWHAVCFLANLNKRYRRLLEKYVAELNTPALRKTIWNALNEDLNFIMNHATPQGLYNYYVICDETNNPPEVIDSGVLNVDIGLEIVRDTRVINLTTTLYKTGGIVESNIKLG